MISLSSILVLVSLAIPASGFGSSGPIAASYGGQDAFFCAIDAGGKQAIFCWGIGTGKNNNNNNPSEKFSNIPPMASLSGGEGFMCGILADSSSRAYCWDSMGLATDLVPDVYRYTSYSRIAAGKSHVCATRGYYYSYNHTGNVDCWDVVRKTDSSTTSLVSQQSGLFYDNYVSGLVFDNIVSGDGFSCGGVREKDGGGLVCWGPNSSSFLGISKVGDSFTWLTSGKNVVCGIVEGSRMVKCWGGKKNDSDSLSYPDPPSGVKFISMAAGEKHFCGIREDTHGVECWGEFNASSVPKGSGFFAISASNVITCGIREVDLVLDCWFVNESVVKSSDFDPPLQLSSPGLCTPRDCSSGEFAYNASTLDEAGLTSLCVRKDLHLCLPCALDCSDGYFVSSPCNDNSNRICSPCSFCQNSSCWAACGLQQRKRWTKETVQIMYWKKGHGSGWCCRSKSNDDDSCTMSWRSTDFTDVRAQRVQRVQRKGKAAAIIDRYVALPRNVEPLLKLADIAEAALGENSPSMEQIAHSLEQIVKEGLVL